MATNLPKNPITIEEIVIEYSLPQWPRGECRLQLTPGWTIGESGNVIRKNEGRRLAEFDTDGVFTGEHDGKFFYFEASDGRKLTIPFGLGRVYIPQPVLEPEVETINMETIIPNERYL